MTAAAEACRVPGGPGYAPVDGSTPPTPEERGRPTRPEPTAVPEVGGPALAGVAVVDLARCAASATGALVDDHRGIRAELDAVLGAGLPRGATVDLDVGDLPADVLAVDQQLWVRLLARYRVVVRADARRLARWMRSLAALREGRAVS